MQWMARGHRVWVMNLVDCIGLLKLNLLAMKSRPATGNDYQRDIVSVTCSGIRGFFV